MTARVAGSTWATMAARTMGTIRTVKTTWGCRAIRNSGAIEAGKTSVPTRIIGASTTTSARRAAKIPTAAETLRTITTR